MKIKKVGRLIEEVLQRTCEPTSHRQRMNTFSDGPFLMHIFCLVWGLVLTYSFVFLFQLYDLIKLPHIVGSYSSDCFSEKHMYVAYVTNGIIL